MPLSPLNPETSLLVLVDLQERLMAAIPEAIVQRTVRRAGHLVAVARDLGIPTLVTEQYPEGLGPTVQPLRDALGGAADGLVRKLDFDATGEPLFVARLDGLYRRRQVILAGVETHICVALTARSLLARGCEVFVASDAAASREKSSWRAGLQLITDMGGTCAPTETLLFDLVGRAEGPVFKAISRRLKEEAAT